MTTSADILSTATGELSKGETTANNLRNIIRGTEQMGRGAQCLFRMFSINLGYH